MTDGENGISKEYLEGNFSAIKQWLRNHDHAFNNMANRIDSVSEKINVVTSGQQALASSQRMIVSNLDLQREEIKNLSHRMTRMETYCSRRSQSYDQHKALMAEQYRELQQAEVTGKIELSNLKTRAVATWKTVSVIFAVIAELFGIVTTLITVLRK